MGENCLATQEFRCDLCHSRIYEHSPRLEGFIGLRQHEGHSIVKCKTCGLVAVYPRPSQEVLDKFYREYGSKKGRLKEELFRMEKIYPAKLARLKKYTKGKRMLDIGAGMGTFVALAQQAGYDVTGIELSEEQCKKAKELYSIDLIRCNLYAIQEPIGQFDIVHLHHVMEHLVSPSKMLKTVHNLLNVGGVLLIEVPNQLPCIKDYLRRNRLNHELRFNFDHLFFFSPKSMKKYIESHGFRIEKFNQYPPEQKSESKNALWKLARSFYRLSTTKAWIPTGKIIEVYCRKWRQT